MAEVQELNLLGTALEGSNLIEASAGTGKTYAITGLFLRLVLELNLPVHEILVVTFTEAATSELKDRIRNRIREAVDVFSGRQTEDAFLRGLYEKCPETDLALRKLTCALADFDHASIFTIHGFCQRALAEHAFESGLLFDAGLAADQAALRQEVVDDWWRREISSGPALLADFALKRGLGPGRGPSRAGDLLGRWRRLGVGNRPDLFSPGDPDPGLLSRQRTRHGAGPGHLQRRWHRAKLGGALAKPALRQ